MSLSPNDPSKCFPFSCEMKLKRNGSSISISISSTMLYYPSSSPSSSSIKDPHSVLQLLPVAILALATSLPLPDREVLAYLLTTSISNPATTTTKRPSHNLPLFTCTCFDCYTSYWFRWDCSPNRELIHQVLEAFEDHLVLPDLPTTNRSQRKRDKLLGHPHLPQIPKKERFLTTLEAADTGAKPMPVAEAVAVAVQLQSPVRNRKGLVRKVLPDVLGLWNSRLWSRWGQAM